MLLTRCPNWQELPKSTILIADRFGLHRRMFSGFKSQCIIFSSGVDRKSNAVHSCCANFLVRFNDTPRKLVFRNRSYRLYDSNSNTKHRWFLHMKCLFNLTEKKKKYSYKQVMLCLLDDNTYNIEFYEYNFSSKICICNFSLFKSKRSSVQKSLSKFQVVPWFRFQNIEVKREF